jgi:leucyl/phenylalanyl-tRNA--protein transferase
MPHQSPLKRPLAWLDDERQPLPPSDEAMGPGSDAPGLLAAGGELTIARLTEAYGRGVFPWYGPGQPVLWWSPDPRMVMPVAEFKLARSLRKTLQKFIRTSGCEIRIDGALETVIRACAGMPRDGQAGTWIVPELIDAYLAWHRAGAVHSFETWVDGELVGGLYGVSLGRMFFGESMFSRRSDASKIAFSALICFCRSHGVTLIDCQQRTAHLASLGAREIPRADFEHHLASTCRAAPITDWTYDPRQWAQLGFG